MQMGCRYPFKRPGINLPMRGLRGSAAGYAAQIWGVPCSSTITSPICGRSIPRAS